ncbi:hypothetical protein [Streptomyces sp. NPDC047014]|uniref:hypothetical protein n=1 Tax=Streptomyces sp. NPDC047014 TaxID=3155736 RepID=UPI0033CAF698
MARHLRDNATDLPPQTAIALIEGLTSPHITRSGGVSARTWLTLTEALTRLAARRDIPHDQLRLITRRFRLQAPALHNDGSAELRLRNLLAEAQTTHLWHGAHRGDAQTTLDTAMTFLKQIPADRQPPPLVIGLLRLARDLAASDWLTEHAEHLLLTLDTDGLQHLRPTDIDWLRTCVDNRDLTAHMDHIEATWRTDRNVDPSYRTSTAGSAGGANGPGSPSR